MNQWDEVHSEPYLHIPKQAQAYHRTCSLSWYRGYFLYREKKVIVLTGLSWINIQKSTRLKFDFLIIYKYCIVANLTLL